MPDKEVVPPLLVARFLIPAKLAPIVVVPLKFRVKSWPAPVTPPVKVGVVPVRMIFPARVNASLKVMLPPEVVISPAVSIFVAPVISTLPALVVMSPAAARVMVVAFKSTVPVPFVVIGLLIVNASLLSALTERSMETDWLAFPGTALKSIPVELTTIVTA